MNLAAQARRLSDDAGARPSGDGRLFGCDATNEIGAAIVAFAKQRKRVSAILAMTRAAGQLTFEDFVWTRRQRKFAEPVYAPDAV
jgi:hypothetical protein